jgi:hypothetical protein
MSYSITQSDTEAFTLTHAKYLAAKIATDLLRFTRFYRNPSIEEINNYEAEVTALLKARYLAKIIYGFHRNAKWVEALMYHALPDGTLVGDDDPGKIRPGTDVPGESFTSHFWGSDRWRALTQAEKERFYANLPIKRSSAVEMPVENGYWSKGLHYSAGGRGIARSTIVRHQ